MLECGFGLEDLTPAVGTRMSGFAVRTQPSIGVHDRLSARALAFRDGESAAVLVVLDVLGIARGWTERIRGGIQRALGVPPEHIGVVATHTHGGPVTLPTALLGTVEPAVERRVIEAAVAAARRAMTARAPATLRFGRGCEPDVGRNRRDRSGPIDATVPVARLDRTDGSLLGLLVSYACHPVTLGPTNVHFTRDYPGFVIDALEERYPGSAVVFATGCCGQINTGHRAEDSLQGIGMERRTFREARRLGHMVAAAAWHECERLVAPDATPIRGTPIAGARRTVSLPLRDATVPSEDQREADRAWLDRIRRDGGSPAERAEAEVRVAWAEKASWDRTTVETEVQWLRIGELHLALFPGEPFVEFGLDLRARHPDLALVTLGYANDAPGYLPTDAAMRDGGYEVEGSYRYYGTPAPYAPGVQAALQSALEDAHGETMRGNAA